MFQTSWFWRFVCNCTSSLCFLSSSSTSSCAFSHSFFSFSCSLWYCSCTETLSSIYHNLYAQRHTCTILQWSINTHAYIHTSRAPCAYIFLEPCTYTAFHQFTCSRRSCSCCQLSRRLRSSLGSQTQWLTRLAKFNMGVSIYPDPAKKFTNTHAHTRTHTHTSIWTKRTEREERWEDKLGYSDYERRKANIG